MDALSPSKRRALAPLDANALASPKALFKDAKAVGGPLGSPVKLSAEGRKRMFEVDASTSPVGKKACLGRDEDASSRGHSPDTSSLFDTSANDASWTTTTTEPDAAAAAAAAAPVAAAALERMPITRPRALTREQAREKVEILRLRLSLANYKVRTGQTNVPLADLQRKPMPRPVPRVRVQSPDDDLPPSSANDEQPPQQDQPKSDDSQATEIDLQHQQQQEEEEQQEQQEQQEQREVQPVRPASPENDDAVSQDSHISDTPPPPSDVSTSQIEV